MVKKSAKMAADIVYEKVGSMDFLNLVQRTDWEQKFKHENVTFSPSLSSYCHYNIQPMCCLGNANN